MILSRRILFTLPVSSIINNPSNQKVTKSFKVPTQVPMQIPVFIPNSPSPTNPMIDTPIDKIPNVNIPSNNDNEITNQKSNEKIVVINDVNDIKFFNHCATIFKLYHDDYKIFNGYKKDQYKKYKMSLIEAYDNSCSMIESEDLKDFVQTQGQTFSIENVCDINECV